MNRIGYMVIRNLISVPRWYFRIWQLGLARDKHRDQEKYDYLRSVVTKLNKSGHITIEDYGTEYLPDEGGFILFPNHQGLFDMLALIQTCPKPLRVVVKKEVSNTILVKQVLALLKGIPMDRTDVRASLEIINRMTEDVKNGKNYVIFAEGTRSKDGNNILKFKAGTFKSAVNARCPIIPVALIDSYKPFDVSSIKRETVQVHYMEPIPYNLYMGKKTLEIADLVHDKIQNKINENISETGLTT